MDTFDWREAQETFGRPQTEEEWHEYEQAMAELYAMHHDESQGK